MKSIYTDLAIESRENFDAEEDIEIDGVRMSVDELYEGEVVVTTVEILNAQGEEHMQKPMGHYITIESSGMKENAMELHENISLTLAEKISLLMDKGKKNGTVLVIGLGNAKVTPDALGPRVVAHVLVTRHIKGTGNLPQEMEGHLCPVCAIAPGVMGNTGIETAEVVRGIVDRVKPDWVVAIDALAARKTSRIHTTIQISDTGIHPGAGLGNRRVPITEKTLGVPVLAIGVPTVVDAATLVNDTLEKLLKSLAEQGGAEIFHDVLSDMTQEEKYSWIAETLNAQSENLFVTPKEVDTVVDRIAHVVAKAINMALHPKVDAEKMANYLY